MTSDDDEFKILIAGICNQGRHADPQLIGNDGGFKIRIGRGRGGKNSNMTGPRFINQVLRARQKGWLRRFDC